MAVSQNKFEFYNEIWESNVEVANNRSIIHCKVYLKTSSWGWQTGNSYSGNINIHGQSYGFTWGPGNSTFPYGSSKTVLIAEWSRWVDHNNDGTLTANISSSYSASGTYSPGYCSDSDTLGCTTIAREAKITSTPDINDEQNPTIQISNPGNFAMLLKIEILPSIGGACVSIPVIRDGVRGTNYTFILTEEERNAFRNYANNKNTCYIRYVVVTNLGGVDYHSTVDKTMLIVNSNPSFTDFTYKDVSNAVNYTGNNQIFIANNSQLEVTIPVVNKAIPQKGASISKYIVKWGSKQKEEKYIEEEIKITGKELYGDSSNVIEVLAVDSRGNSTKITKSIEVLDYQFPVIKNVISKRVGGVAQTTNLAFDGTYWNKNFGAFQNDITVLKYRYKKKDTSAYSEYIDVTSDKILSDSTFKFDKNIKGDLDVEGFSMENNFDIEVTVVDKIGSYIINTVLQSAKPLLALKPSEGVAIGKIYDSDLGGRMQVENLNAKNINVSGINLEEQIYMNYWKPVHRRVLFGMAGDNPVTASGEWAYLGTIQYGIVSYGLSQIPIPSGYTRIIRLYCVWSGADGGDGSNKMQINIVDENDGNKYDIYNFGNTWGGIEPKRDGYSENYNKIDSLNVKGHSRIYIRSSNPTKQERIYWLEILSYDIPNTLLGYL